MVVNGVPFGPCSSKRVQRGLYGTERSIYSLNNPLTLLEL
jgi:hypothetical protein